MERESLMRIVDTHGPAAVVEALRPYLTEPRRTRIDAVIAGRMQGVHVAIEAPSDPHNAAAVVRTAEALGALGVHVIAAEGKALHAKSTTQGAYHWVHTEHHASLSAFVSMMRAQGRRLYGAAADGDLTVEQIPIEGPVCLVLGNEQRGLSKEVRVACEGCFRIPMFGMSESLNLSVSAAIGLHDVLRRRRALVGPSDLPLAQADRLRALYYLRSVDSRLASGLLEGKRA